MTTAIVPSDVEAFRRALCARFGLQFDESRVPPLADLLRRRAGAAGLAVPAYLARLERDPAPAELRVLAQEVTVGETFFFRNADQFRALTESVLPERVRALGGVRRLRLLSAGCASGEEAFTLVMALREAGIDATWDLTVVGADVNPAALARAARGRFGEWSLRETPEPARRRWFRTEGREAVLDPSIRGHVRFVERNLNDPASDLWQPGSWDVVFCRNVLMYLVPDAARGVIHRIARSLVPGGHVFLGHAETLRGLSSAFHLVHTHGTFYYRRREAGERPGGHADGAPDAAGDAAPAGPVAGADAEPPADAWVDAIRNAAERIAALTSAPPPPFAEGDGAPAADPAVAAPSFPAWDLTLALELVRLERYADALDAVRALPAESSADPDVALLHASILTHCGRLTEAEDLCRALLVADELNAAAHFLLALCREGAGDLVRAAEHDRTAAYLDPAFAMPRLHLGRIARRQGDPRRARDELERALPMLEREDAARILLFGGGFGRSALVALCRSELAACGGRP